MKLNNSGVPEGHSEKDFNAKYRDTHGKLLWRKLTDDIVASGQSPKTFEEAARELAEYYYGTGEEKPQSENDDHVDPAA